MIPQSIKAGVGKRLRAIAREDASEVFDALASLGVPATSTFAALYLLFVGPFLGRRGTPELGEITLPINQVAQSTDYARDALGLPEGFLCLTSLESEGGYFYEIATESVFDLGIEQVELLADGSLSPRWPSFLAFIEWFFDAGPGPAR